MDNALHWQGLLSLFVLHLTRLILAMQPIHKPTLVRTILLANVTITMTGMFVIGDGVDNAVASSITCVKLILGYGLIL